MILLAALVVLTLFSIDTYLPAMPAILSAILGFIHSDNIMPMTTMMLLSSIVSVISYRLLIRR